MAEEYVGVPWQGWAETQADLLRVSLTAAIALTIAALTLLALFRKGVLTFADLNPLAAL